MSRNREIPFPVFLLVSAVLNFLLIQLLFLNLKVDPETLKDPEKKQYIELVELPFEETEPPDELARLAEKSHKAKKETTRDDTTRLSRSVPSPSSSTPAAPKPPGAVEPGDKEKNREKFSPEKDQVAFLPRGEKGEPEKKKTEPTREPPSDSRSAESRMVKPNVADVPYDYNTDEQLLGAKVDKKEITVDLNTTEYKYISYFTKLKERIYQVWQYPRESRMRREQGDIRIVFTLRKDGYLEDVRILRSSGFESLDREVLRTIRVASPYNPFPKSWDEDTIKIPATFDYRLPTWVRYYN